MSGERQEIPPTEFIWIEFSDSWCALPKRDQLTEQAASIEVQIDRPWKAIVVPVAPDAAFYYLNLTAGYDLDSEEQYLFAPQLLLEFSSLARHFEGRLSNNERQSLLGALAVLGPTEVWLATDNYLHLAVPSRLVIEAKNRIQTLFEGIDHPVGPA